VTRPVAGSTKTHLHHAQHIRAQFRIILVPGRPPRAVAEHRAIVEAVAARDPDAAEAAMRDHLAHVYRHCVSSLQPARRFDRPVVV
jgi:DNA-binding GntR family transcriptional regulator